MDNTHFETLARALKKQKPSLKFRSNVFHPQILQQKINAAAFEKYVQVLNGRGKMSLELADEIAEALKEWALQRGATHYTHLFQPLTGAGAEKHDAFLSWGSDGNAIEKFRGKDLMRGEPDASSFPSGGLRSTHEARGYTVWDPAASPFLWEGGEGVTLCIPALFFSWKGEALDAKIPLLRSEQKLEKSVLRLTKLCGVKAERVFSTLGPEQEFFVIERRLYALRPDLVMAGRTVYGAKPAKGQELEDHYFGAIKDRVLSYLRDVEEASLKIGIPLKTRHNEVAPSQFEIAPLFEASSAAVDHNVLLMELLRQKAAEHDLACLLHEKPFAGINGSGKHCNWSIATDTGLNLLDPNEESLVFLILLTAVLRAVHEHAALLRASIGSVGNDYRLGGSEAPPTILSVYLGEMLEKMVDRVIEGKKSDPEMLKMIDLGLSHLASQTADASDRNRTSFFAFTGNKFEFRAVGASAHCALPITVLNAIVADSLHLILDEIKDALKDSKDLSKALPVIRKHLKIAKPVIFGGNGYSSEWEKEAKRRGLPNFRKSFHPFSQFLDPRTVRAFEEILSEDELHSRYEIFVEQYAKGMSIESHLMIELFRSSILPAALEDQKNRSMALRAKSKALKASFEKFASSVEAAIVSIDQLEKAVMQIKDLGWEAKGKVYCELIAPKMDKSRKCVDLLETLVDRRLWPLPKYSEILFSI